MASDNDEVEIVYSSLEFNDKRNPSMEIGVEDSSNRRIMSNQTSNEENEYILDLHPIRDPVIESVSDSNHGFKISPVRIRKFGSDSSTTNEKGMQIVSLVTQRISPRKCRRQNDDKNLYVSKVYRNPSVLVNPHEKMTKMAPTSPYSKDKTSTSKTQAIESIIGHRPNSRNPSSKNVKCYLLCQGYRNKNHQCPHKTLASHAEELRSNLSRRRARKAGKAHQRSDGNRNDRSQGSKSSRHLTRHLRTISPSTPPPKDEK